MLRIKGKSDFFRFIISVAVAVILLFCSTGTVSSLAENSENGSIQKNTDNSQAEEEKLVSISFITSGGSECETIYGYAGKTKITEDMLPTPTRYGYIFKNWRHFNEYGMPFELDVFPNYDITLVARWEPNGFSVTFEEGINQIYDYNSGIELYAPDIKNYSQDSVKSGWRCLRTKKDSAISPMFLLSYKNKLETGKEYELIMWLKTDKIGTRGSVDFLYSDYPDVRAEAIGYHKAFDFSDMKKGEWCEYRVKFVAAAPYVFIRTPKNCTLYFDDIQVEHTGATGQPADLSKVTDSNNIPTIALALIAVAAAVFIALILIKRRKHNKGI